jgi:hypothetical protein
LSKSILLFISNNWFFFKNLFRDIPIEKRNNFILETGKIIVPVDSELFNVGFQSSSIPVPNGDFWVHERCLKWSLTDGDKINDHEFIRTIVINATKQVD